MDPIGKIAIRPYLRNAFGFFDVAVPDVYEGNILAICPLSKEELALLLTMINNIGIDQHNYRAAISPELLEKGGEPMLDYRSRIIAYKMGLPLTLTSVTTKPIRLMTPSSQGQNGPGKECAVTITAGKNESINGSDVDSQEAYSQSMPDEPSMNGTAEHYKNTLAGNPAIDATKLSTITSLVRLPRAHEWTMFLWNTRVFEPILLMAQNPTKFAEVYDPNGLLDVFFELLAQWADLYFEWKPQQDHIEKELAKAWMEMLERGSTSDCEEEPDNLKDKDYEYIEVDVADDDD
ncbi:uncharacterized protein BCR38DRAFT_407684 [Pseudomassariella vexata]|uniref:Uncharacterized protein n=1 Tax=Pseudomassariella vexata TaxID=1141098 RepID=A0A1Y2E860_9PEZI|nr:uncharacterized protein BCR38DRAFT_407684 [Pseudomassariella vexata]ORY67740.1 hypothetical protein BCR38DRAFT_407684 [Pseudomassariella vexata]